jgi:hypothetical protein
MGMQVVDANAEVGALDRLAALLGEGGCVVLSGAGCSTESGSHYQAQGRATGLAHSARRVLARSGGTKTILGAATLGLNAFGARPNRAHRALAAGAGRRGGGVITRDWIDFPGGGAARASSSFGASRT